MIARAASKRKPTVISRMRKELIVKEKELLARLREIKRDKRSVGLGRRKLRRKKK